ncbi:hypothetical protein RHMOL_Rhmol10G0294700 [Rhododendron molle]|uniref:Uncharacterized protein n=1 Tax=Rhododendron molle TaxID=49168 RepID=A0ACC0M830_RHOML|nr:hypothetical protein RHMOL_Rhmol10G0294700 [Rhododendron molle]
MMVVLELKDAVDWIYREEGAANLVLAYSGSSHTFEFSFMLHSYDDFVVSLRVIFHSTIVTSLFKYSYEDYVFDLMELNLDVLTLNEYVLHNCKAAYRHTRVCPCLKCIDSESLQWMEVELELKDAVDWIYRGEGAANLVLAYSGSSPTFVGKVLRIQKAPGVESPRNGNDSEDSHSALANDECLFWRETEDLVSAPTREIAEQLYVQHVISPLLGYEHVDGGIRVYLSKEFLEVAKKNILSQRPSQ